MKIRTFSKKGIAAAVILLIAVVSINSCKKDDNTTTNGNTQVVMQSTAFSPASITIAKNATVTWTNKDGYDHNVTSDSGWFSSGTIAAGATYSKQFTTSGTYPYSCTIHQGMRGTVIVQ